MEENQNEAPRPKRQNPFWNSNHNSFSKYAVVATVFFLIFITFISSDNLVRWFRARSEYHEQERTKAELRKGNAEKQARLDAILGTGGDSLARKAAVEKHARESAHFAKEGEEVWLIDE